MTLKQAIVSDYKDTKFKAIHNISILNRSSKNIFIFKIISIIKDLNFVIIYNFFLCVFSYLPKMSPLGALPVDSGKAV